MNPQTNKVYVANEAANSVSVIDGNTNGKIDIPLASGPTALAVNPITNKIYVTNSDASSVAWLIDPATT